MHTFTKALLFVSCLIIFSITISKSHANIVYSWSGDCQEELWSTTVPLCSRATVQVTTTDAYTPGEESENADLLLGFRYSDENVTFDFHLLTFGAGERFLLPAGLSGAGFLYRYTKLFETDTQGNWRFAGEELIASPCEPQSPFSPLCGYDVRGNNGVWSLDTSSDSETSRGEVATTVPEPSTLLLLLLSLSFLAALRMGLVREQRS